MGRHTVPRSNNRGLDTRLQALGEDWDLDNPETLITILEAAEAWIVYRAKQRGWREAHHTELLEYERQRYQGDPQSNLSRFQERYAADPEFREKVKAQRRERYAKSHANPDHG